MSLQAGQSLGGFTIVSKIGEGGMGEVYRATDTRLGRDVAIKVLPPSVASDPERRARFEREAKALAALNHANIAQVYGFEGTAIVMELLEGQTLRERINSGALPVRKALEFGAQIARGLAAAHERGIIHRDLKPENIFIVNDGQIKILDFGLARQATDPVDATVTGHGTAPGVVLGTVGYMSPEQVRGQVADTRSDVFALGVILYEMLTGQRAFRRDSAAETMSAILNDHPRDLSEVRGEVSPAIDRIVQHCLEKQPSERFQSARDAAFALDALSGPRSSQHAATPMPARSRERLAWGALTAGLAVMLGWLALTPAPPSASTGVVTRAVIPLPDNLTPPEPLFPGLRFSLSDDGARIVFAARDRITGRQSLYIQPLDGGPLQPIANTANGGAPIFSADGRELLFTDAARLLRLSLDSGAPVVLLDQSVILQRGTWDPSGVVLIGGVQLRSISLQGGSVTVLREKEGERYGNPFFLPDRRRFLVGVANTRNEVSVRLMSLDAQEDHELISGLDINAFQYAAGALLFTRGSTLYGQRLDLSKRALLGTPVVMVTAVDSGPLRGAAFAASDSGVLIYQGANRLDSRQLTWFDRTGKVIATVGEPADFSNIELSRDGRRLLTSATDAKVATRDIFIIDVNRGIRQRFTLDPSEERSAIWSPDQKDVIYTSKGLNLYRRPADLSGEERVVNSDPGSKDPYDWSPDGRWLLYRRSASDTGNDLWLMPLAGGEPRPVANTRFSEVGGNFSPDGKWIVYVSDESGQFEIYATRVEGGGRIQISAQGGNYPRWRDDGREIVFLSGRTMMSAAVTSTASTLEIAVPRPLFELDVENVSGPVYDISPDGSRFIVAARVASRTPPSIGVLTNWPLLLSPP